MTPDSQSSPNRQPSQPVPPPAGGYPPPQPEWAPAPQPSPGGGYPPQPQPSWAPAPPSPTSGYPPYYPPQQPGWASPQPPSGFAPAQQVPYGGFPPPPLPPSAPPTNSTRTIIAVIVVVALVAAGIGAIFAFSPRPGATVPSATSTDTSGLGSGSGFGQSIPSSQHHHVGENVKLGNIWKMTVNSAMPTQGGQFDQPKAGDQYILVDVTVQNISTNSQDLFSTDFQLKDATGQVYVETFLSTSNNPPDGTVQSGDNIRGQIAFEVPTNQHNLSFTYTYNFNYGQVEWDLRV